MSESVALLVASTLRSGVMKRRVAVAASALHRNDSASIAFLQGFCLNPYGSRLIRERLEP